MTDEELIVRLQELADFETGVGVMQDFYCGDEMIAAAARIKALIAERNKATLWAIEQHALADNYALRISQEKAKLAKAVELLEEIEVGLAPISGFFIDTFPRKQIKATLAEIK